MFLINTIVAIVLLLAYFIPHIKPSSIGVIPLLSLIVPILIIINIVFIIYWVLIGIKRQYALSFVVLIIGLFAIPSPYKFGSTSESSDNELTLMTFNVRKFNMYEWLDDKNISAKIDTFITNERPDIVALQEYKEDENFKLSYPYSYNHYSQSTNYSRVKTYQSGLAIFSKYRIINKGSVEYKPSFSSMIFADIVKHKDTIRIYNLHLESLGVIPDKDFFGHKDSEKLFKRLNTSFRVQQTEIDTLNYHIEKCKYRVIIAGDINNTAFSWAYKNLKKNRKDSFLEAGSGFGKTYSFKGFPLRIDYIFASESVQINQHKNYTVKYSDHHPVMATLAF